MPITSAQVVTDGVMTWAWRGGELALVCIEPGDGPRVDLVGPKVGDELVGFVGPGFEEGIVRAISARRLVPLGELAILLDRNLDMGHTPEVWKLAEECGVTDTVMAEALKQLALEG